MDRTFSVILIDDILSDFDIPLNVEGIIVEEDIKKYVDDCNINNKYFDKYLVLLDILTDRLECKESDLEVASLFVQQGRGSYIQLSLRDHFRRCWDQSDNPKVKVVEYNPKIFTSKFIGLIYISKDKFRSKIFNKDRSLTWREQLENSLLMELEAINAYIDQQYLKSYND